MNRSEGPAEEVAVQSAVPCIGASGNANLRCRKVYFWLPLGDRTTSGR